MEAFSVFLLEKEQQIARCQSKDPECRFDSKDQSPGSPQREEQTGVTWALPSSSPLALPDRAQAGQLRPSPTAAAGQSDPCGRCDRPGLLGHSEEKRGKRPKSTSGWWQRSSCHPAAPVLEARPLLLGEAGRVSGPWDGGGQPGAPLQARVRWAGGEQRGGSPQGPLRPAGPVPRPRASAAGQLPPGPNGAKARREVTSAPDWPAPFHYTWAQGSHWLVWLGLQGAQSPLGKETCFQLLLGSDWLSAPGSRCPWALIGHAPLVSSGS